MRQQIVGNIAVPETPREVERRLHVACLRIYIGACGNQCLNAIEAGKLGGGMKDCIAIEGGIGIGTLLQQQVDQLNFAFSTAANKAEPKFVSALTSAPRSISSLAAARWPLLTAE